MTVLLTEHLWFGILIITVTTVGINPIISTVRGGFLIYYICFGQL